MSEEQKLIDSGQAVSMAEARRVVSQRKLRDKGKKTCTRCKKKAEKLHKRGPGEYCDKCLPQLQGSYPGQTGQTDTPGLAETTE